jgi:acetyl esterase/lipase
MIAAVRILLFLAVLVLAFLTSWIFLPPPNRTLLALAVGAPELSAWLVVCGLLLCIVTIAVGGRGSLAQTTFALAAVATVLASVPLARLPLVTRRFDRAMRTALGTDYLSAVPPERRAAMRPAPVVLVDLFRGLDSDHAGDTRVTRGIPWVSSGGERLTIDIYQPVARGLHPAIVQIYGGAWQRGAPADDAGYATYLAAHGFVVFAIDYRHAPRWPWPAQIDDVRAAIAWVRKNGAEYGGDASRMALLGRSAGAHLAMIAAYQLGAPVVSAVVSYYGPVDMTDGYRDPPRPDPLDVRSIDIALLGGTPDQMPDRYRDASPIMFATRRVPPSLLIYGGRDHVVMPRFGAMLDQRLRAINATSVYLEIPWAEHAFDAIPNGPSAQLALYYTERFLAWALTRPGP